MINLNYFGTVALVSFLIALAFILLGLKFFPKLKLMDRPLKYGLKRDPIPYYGGTLIYLAFVVCCFIFLKFSVELLGLMLAATIIVVTGFLDDYFSLPPVIRLIVQALCAFLLVFFGVKVLSITSPFGGVLDLSFLKAYGVPIFSVIFSIIWVVLITNTMNFLDGVGGLTSGVSFIAYLTIFFLSIRPGIHENLASQETVATIALIIAFVSLAFTVFDFPPAKILMGDTGSTFLGFMLAALSMYSGGKIATAFLVLGVPILDAGWVILRRISEGKKPWKGDLKHLHHRLLNFGFKDHTVLLIIYSLSVVFGILAVISSTARQKFSIIIGLLVLMLVLVIGLFISGKRKSKSKNLN